MSTTELATTLTTELPLVFQLAEKLVPTGMLPTWIKQPGQAVAIILAGRELGMEPMRALRSLQMVQGKVVEAADSQLGRFKAAGGRATFARLDDTCAELHLTHPNGDEHTETFTIAQAKAAGLTGKDIWQKYPRAMLRSRVITAGLKSVGWDGTVGEYDPEEAEEIGKPTLAAAPTVKMPTRLSARSNDGDTGNRGSVGDAGNPSVLPAEPIVAAARSTDVAGGRSDSAGRGDGDRADTGALPLEPELGLQPEPIPVDDLEPAEVVERDQTPISEPQRRRLFALAREYGHSKDAVSAYLRRRGIQSSKDLPLSQYDNVVARLSDATPMED